MKLRTVPYELSVKADDCKVYWVTDCESPLFISNIQDTECCGSSEIWGVGALSYTHIINLLKATATSILLFHTPLNGSWNDSPYLPRIQDYVNRTCPEGFKIHLYKFDHNTLLCVAEILDADIYYEWRTS